MPDYSGKGIRMNYNGSRPQNMNGYPQQSNYMTGGYPGAYFGQTGGNQNYTAANQQPATGQSAGYNPGVPGYQPPQAAAQNGYPQYASQQNNSNTVPQAGYAPASGMYGSQPVYPPAGQFSGQTGYPSGYSAAQENTNYSAGPVFPGYPAGNPQYMISGNGGSFIPQTPYSPGYTSPGYAAPANSTRYQNGFNVFGQMGREPQNTTQAEQFVRQMPLNGGGYVPPPVPVRRPPFRLSDTMLVLIGAILLILFVIAVPVMGSLPLKILFIALAAGFTVLLWIKPLTAENKRLCFTIVAAALCIATIVSFISGGTRNNADPTVTRPTGASISITDSISGTAKNSGLQVSGVEQTTAEPASTPALDEDTAYVQQRVLDFFNAWKSREFNTLVDMCTPSWRSKSENARTDLFNILSTRTPVKDIMFESISGTSADTSRQITLVADIDYNNGKDPVKQRINVMLKQENNDWFIDPESLRSYKKIETADPNITPEVKRTEEPPTDPNTMLYYNPDGGKLYHRDPNCKSANPKNLPFKGSFLYSQLGEHPDLNRCTQCRAPLRPYE